MPTLYANRQLTFVEIAKRMHNGSMLPVAEILQGSRPCLDQAVVIEANDQFTHVSTQRYSLPAGTFRRFNAGVPTEMSQVIQIRDQLGMLGSMAQHDKDLVDKSGGAEFRNQENTAFIEGLGQTMATTLWYGNALVDTEQWTGLAPRMPSLNGKNVQGCGGTGSDVSSLYLLQWRADRVAMLTPPGTPAGLRHLDLGTQLVLDGNNYKYLAYVDDFKWDGGLCVRDPRAIGRIANIETSGSSNIFNEDVLISVKNWMRDQGRGAVGYCSVNIYTQILIAIKDKSNVFLSIKDPFGDAEVPALLGIPIYVDEMISETETAIS